jgi:hypothetical protein
MLISRRQLLKFSASAAAIAGLPAPAGHFQDLRLIGNELQTYGSSALFLMRGLAGLEEVDIGNFARSKTF